MSKTICLLLCYSLVVFLTACGDNNGGNTESNRTVSPALSGSVQSASNTSGKPVTDKAHRFFPGMNNDPMMMQQLIGNWRVISAFEGRNKINQPASFWLFTEGKLEIRQFGRILNTHDFMIDTASTPNKLQLRFREDPISKGIFQVDGDRLNIAIAPPGEAYPTTFERNSDAIAYFQLQRYIHPDLSNKERAILQQLQGTWEAIPSPGSDIKRVASWKFTDRLIVISFNGSEFKRMTIDDLDAGQLPYLLTHSQQEPGKAKFTEISPFEISDTELRFFGRDGKVLLNFRRIPDKK
ncbi:MAG: hypothetical protein R3B84_17650 [Zavarzinella sp.]